MSNGSLAAVLAPVNTEPRQRIAVRLLPFYVMLYIFSSQPHKEERFMFVVYPLICFNAALGLYCLNRVLESTLHDLSVLKVEFEVETKVMMSLPKRFLFKDEHPL